MKKPQHFLFLLVEEFAHIAFSCAVEPLRIANLVSGEELYTWSFASEDGTLATCSNGSQMLVQHSFDDLPNCDRAFVLSGGNMTDYITPNLVGALRQLRLKGVKLGGLCSGAWILGEIGFLDGKRAAIHWEFHDGFVERFHNISLINSIFVADENIITASGGTATADLMLHLVEIEHGYDLSLTVADQMVYSASRDAESTQKRSFQSRYAVRNAYLARAVQMMKDQIEEPVSTASIAEEIGISARQLERLFGKYTHTSPKKYYMDLRMERARHLLNQTEASISEIALACGFDNPAYFSKIFRSTYGHPPSQARQDRIVTKAAYQSVSF
ncbi:GlxA family transcriptional regulator [Curvivirga sp.]|uniref:GlxA family transcriptional regulator n=1 Tax=Curvivirga sp. TaxID=2856848 RepID=UPI003B5B80B2